MCLKIRCDGKSEKFCKIFWEVNETRVIPDLPVPSRTSRQAAGTANSPKGQRGAKASGALALPPPRGRAPVCYQKKKKRLRCRARCCLACTPTRRRRQQEAAPHRRRGPQLLPRHAHRNPPPRRSSLPSATLLYPPPAPTSRYQPAPEHPREDSHITIPDDAEEKEKRSTQVRPHLHALAVSLSSRFLLSCS